MTDAKLKRGYIVGAGLTLCDIYFYCDIKTVLVLSQAQFCDDSVVLES